MFDFDWNSVGMITLLSTYLNIKVPSLHCWYGPSLSYRVFGWDLIPRVSLFVKCVRLIFMNLTLLKWQDDCKDLTGKAMWKKVHFIESKNAMETRLAKSYNINIEKLNCGCYGYNTYSNQYVSYCSLIFLRTKLIDWDLLKLKIWVCYWLKLKLLQKHIFLVRFHISLTSEDEMGDILKGKPT